MPLLSKKSAPKKTIPPVLSTHWLFTVYLALVSLVAVIVMSVNLGEIRQCEEPRYVWNESVERTQDEIDACVEKATQRAIAARSINLKETFIESLAWFAVFGLLFWFHYPKFLATREKK